MPFGKLKSSSQKPEEISFSDILDADEIASAASRMVRSFVRILTLLIVATPSFVVGVYVGPTKEGKELRALITARITSLRSELHRKIEEVKTAPEEAARPTEPASGEPEPGPLALSPNKPGATPGFVDRHDHRSMSAIRSSAVGPNPRMMSGDDNRRRKSSRPIRSYCGRASSR